MPLAACTCPAGGRTGQHPHAGQLRRPDQRSALCLILVPAPPAPGHRGCSMPETCSHGGPASHWVRTQGRCLRPATSTAQSLWARACTSRAARSAAARWWPTAPASPFWTPPRAPGPPSPRTLRRTALTCPPGRAGAPATPEPAPQHGCEGSSPSACFERWHVHGRGPAQARASLAPRNGATLLTGALAGAIACQCCRGHAAWPGLWPGPHLCTGEPHPRSATACAYLRRLIGPKCACSRCRHAVAAVGPFVFMYGGLRGSTLLDDCLLVDDAAGTDLTIYDPRSPVWCASLSICSAS